MQRWFYVLSQDGSQVQCEEMKYFHAFLPLGFQKVYKRYLLILVALPDLIDTLLNSCQLESSFYDFFDAETKVQDTEIFPQNIIVESSGIAFIAFFSQEKPLR